MLSAYIHGSFIKDRPFSDIDIGIIISTSKEDIVAYELALEAALERTIKYPVDVRVLNHAPLSFCQNVIREGKVVLDRDPIARSDFEGLTLKKYFDFYRFRRRYLEDVTNAPL
jgi:hypothetical protein